MSSNITNFKKSIRIEGNKPVEVLEQVDVYTYTLASSANLAPGGTSTNTVSIQADADFVCEQIAYMADIAGGAQTSATRIVPLARILLNDTGSGRNLSDIAMDLSAFAGYGALPFILPVPRRFAARSTIQCIFTNYSAAETYANLRLYLIGYKAWQM
jgi:hypothetical protein